MRGSRSAQRGDRRCAVSLGHSGSLINGKSRCRLGHVISCVQSQLINDDQCALMISVAPAVPPVSVHQCQLAVLIHATCQCPSVPHVRAHLSCLSVSPISATYQCCQSVPPINAANQCPSLLPISARQCHLIVPVSARQ
ncbi:unnamed protein product, partial [Staurois parvus]